MHYAIPSERDNAFIGNQGCAVNGSKYTHPVNGFDSLKEIPNGEIHSTICKHLCSFLTDK